MGGGFPGEDAGCDGGFYFLVYPKSGLTKTTRCRTKATRKWFGPRRRPRRRPPLRRWLNVLIPSV